jgi:hypothetical protein
MKRARLIKRTQLSERQPSVAPSEAKSSAVRQAVTSVREWVRGHKATQEAQARRMFSALFAQPQAD